MKNKTIFSLSTAPGLAGISVIRSSGPSSLKILQKITGKKKFKPRYSYYGPMFSESSKSLLDKGIYIWFPDPKSYTGEDMFELHLHGGRAVSESMLNYLSKQKDFRLAEPGEFTRRAFVNNKLSLIEVEAISDLIHAETEAQRIQASRQLGGELSEKYAVWSSKIKNMLANTEAAIDFSDEELPKNLLKNIGKEVKSLSKDLDVHLQDGRRGERLREGYLIAVIGFSNVGKSSLVNRICQRDATIVSKIPGTTRDSIEIHLDLSGYAVTLIDTAGIRKTTDIIEIEGIKRTNEAAGKVDQRFVVVPSNLSKSRVAKVCRMLKDGDFLIVNKMDLLRQVSDFKRKIYNFFPNFPKKNIFFCSALRGHGIIEIIKSIQKRLSAEIGYFPKGDVYMTRARHRESLEKTSNFLKKSIYNNDLELIAEDLRSAMKEIGKITGKVAVEDILDVIFREFCIGK